MTRKSISLKNEELIKKIEVGTILKKGGDLFMVVSILDDVNKIQDDLFHSHIRGKVNYVDNTCYYTLISLTKGSNYCRPTRKLTDLHKYIIDNKEFREVESIRFKETSI